MVSLPAKDKAAAPGAELVNDGAYIKRLLKDIDGAKTSIDAVIYMFTVDLDRKKDQVRDFCDALISAQKRGLSVSIVVDQGQKPNSDRAPKSADAVAYLNKHGVKARYESKARVTHAKAIVIDGKTAYLGSANWTYSAWNRNHEANVRLTDPVLVRQLLDYIREISREGQ